jgi:outer membrane protein assembly factor BamB
MTQEWRATWQEGVSGRELLSAVAVHDRFGIVLTGSSEAESARGALTVYYALEGALRWSDFCTEATSGESLLFGSDGGVFVGCYTQEPTMTHLLRYDSQGRRVWRAVWEGVNRYVQTTHLLPAPAGGVYALGTFAPGDWETSDDPRPAFVRRHAADGAVLWTRLLANREANEQGEFRACLLGEGHTVYALLARSVRGQPTPTATLLALAPDGKTRWTRRVPIAPASQAALHWLAPNRLTLATLEPSGRRSVVRLRAFDPQRGAPLWTRACPEGSDYFAAATTDTGNLLVALLTERGERRMLVVRACDPKGQWRWTRTIPAPTRYFWMTTARGAVSVWFVENLSRSIDDSELRRLWLYRLDSGGRIIERRSWQPAQKRLSALFRVGTTPKQLVLCGGGSDFTVASFAPDLTLQWAQRYDHRAPGTNLFPSIALPDGAGGAFVSGVRDRRTYPATPNAWVARFNATGQLAWGEITEEPFAYPLALARAPEGGLYGAGWRTHADAALVVFRWNQSGKRLWTRTLEKQPSDLEAPSLVALCAAPQQGLYLLTTVWREVSAQDWLLMRLDADGRVVWRRVFNGVDNGADTAFALCADADGNLYAAGLTTRVRGEPKLALLSYDAAGKLRWSLERASPFSNPEQPRALTMALACGVDGTLHLLVAQQQDAQQASLCVYRYRSDGAPAGETELPTVRHRVRTHFSGCLAPDGALWLPTFEEEHQVIGENALLRLKAALHHYAPDGTLKRELPVIVEQAEIVSVQAVAWEDARALVVALTARLPIDSTRSVPTTRHHWALVKYHVDSDRR